MIQIYKYGIFRIELLIGILFLILNLSCASRNSFSSSGTWKETYGEISGTSRNHYLTYYANGTGYKMRFYGTFYGMPNTDTKFLVKYDSINPQNAEIVYHRPIFIANEETKKFPAEVIEFGPTFSKLSSKNTITYRYNADGYILEKEQGLPDDYRNLYSELNVGKKYEVEVWVENAHRAVLNLDKPIGI